MGTDTVSISKTTTNSNIKSIINVENFDVSTFPMKSHKNNIEFKRITPITREISEKHINIIKIKKHSVKNNKLTVVEGAPKYFR